MNHALRTQLVLSLVALGALSGCSKSAAFDSRDSAPSSAAAPAAMPVAAATATPDGVAGIPTARSRALVVTLEMALTVENIDLAVGKVRMAVERAGGYIGDARATGSDRERRAHMTLRVPTSQASDLRGALGALGKVSVDNETAVDVTEEHADLEARLRNARAQEQRIAEIMKNSTGTIADVLYAEAEVGKVRANIERMEAQKVTLDRTIEMATLQLELTLPSAVYVAPKAATETPGESILAAAKGGVHGVYVALVYLAMAVAALLPFLLPLAAIAYAAYRFARSRRQGQTAVLHG